MVASIGQVIDSKGLNILLREIDGRTRTYPVKKSVGYEEGFVHHYKKNGKEQYCATLSGYRTENIRGKNYIGQIEGHIPAVPLLGNPDPESPGENYALLLRTHLYSEGHKTLTGSNDIPWKWILGGLAVLVVLFVGYMVFKPKPVSEPVTPEVPGNTPVVVTMEGIDGRYRKIY